MTLMRLFIVFTFFVCTSMINGWSTLEKSAFNNKFNQEAAEVLGACHDTFESCHLFEEECGRKGMKSRCPKTCGLCRAVFPMSCHASEWGCCWDGVTVSGPNGEGCPVCEDRFSMCSKFKEKCYSEAVKQVCPSTCNVENCFRTSSLCEDDPQQAHFCELFKSSGFCQNDISLMVKVCKKTCDLCAHETSSSEFPIAKRSEEDELIDKLQKQVDEALAKKESRFEALESKEITNAKSKLDTKTSLQEFLEEKIRQEKLEHDKSKREDLLKKSENTNKQSDNVSKKSDITSNQVDNGDKKSDISNKLFDTTNKQSDSSNKISENVSVKILSVVDNEKTDKKEKNQVDLQTNEGNLLENSNVTNIVFNTEKETDESLLQLIKSEQKKHENEIGESNAEDTKHLNKVVEDTTNSKKISKDPLVIKNSDTDALLKMLEELPASNVREAGKRSQKETDELIEIFKEKMNSEKLRAYKNAKMEEDEALLQLLEKDEAAKTAAQVALNSLTGGL